MTEQTQTTAERIRAQIYYQLHGEFYSLETANEEVSRVSNAIAAEIDRLTAERDSYEAGMRFQFDRAEDYKAQRDEARALATSRENARDILAKAAESQRKTIDVMAAQLAEARAMASEREDFRLKQIADIRQERDAYREGYNRLTAQLAEARAEVERLRLPAEAWRTLEAYREAERNGTSEEAEGARRVHIPIRDAARARAAKESL